MILIFRLRLTLKKFVVHLNASMDLRQPTIFPLLGALIAIALFLGTAYLWYGFWQAEKMKFAVEESLQNTENSNVDSVVTTTPSVVAATSTSGSENTASSSTTPVTKPTSSLRTAVSPLTGTLVLQEGDVNLDVPYTSQAPQRDWSAPWQDACEEAAILMIDAYVRGYGLSPLSSKDELLRMVAWQEERNWFTSINAVDVQKFFVEYLNYKRPVKIIANPTVEQIKQFLNEGKPVLALAHGKTLGNKYYSNGGPEYHAFVIRGYTKDKFITNDPGVNRGANFLFPIENVMNSLRDWNGGDVTNGQPVIIVVE